MQAGEVSIRKYSSYHCIVAIMITDTVTYCESMQFQYIPTIFTNMYPHHIWNPLRNSQTKHTIIQSKEYTCIAYVHILWALCIKIANIYFLPYKDNKRIEYPHYEYICYANMDYSDST